MMLGMLAGTFRLVAAVMAAVLVEGAEPERVRDGRHQHQAIGQQLHRVVPRAIDQALVRRRSLIGQERPRNRTGGSFVGIRRTMASAYVDAVPIACRKSNEGTVVTRGPQLRAGLRVDRV
jgi:hypothetical protein